jgi:predicted ribosome quality control (RQC) complex YloA/Tae2 family protein
MTDPERPDRASRVDDLTAELRRRMGEAKRAQAELDRAKSRLEMAERAVEEAIERLTNIG